MLSFSIMMMASRRIVWMHNHHHNHNHLAAVTAAVTTAASRRTRTTHHLAAAFSTVSSSSTTQRWLSTNTTTTTTTSKPIIPGKGLGKTSTGIVGLAVEYDWHTIMRKKFQLLLDRLEASEMPVTAQYRIDVTKWCRYVLRVVEAHPPDDPEGVEDAINMGQVEELIAMADDEMIAMDTYLRTRMWELVEQSVSAVDLTAADPTKDPFAPDGDARVAEALRNDFEAMKQQRNNPSASTTTTTTTTNTST